MKSKTKTQPSLRNKVTANKNPENKSKILIIDSNLFVMQVVVAALNENGYKTIETTSDNQKAYKLLKSNQYDFVYLALSIGKVNALDLLQKLSKEQKEKNKIVIFSNLYHPAFIQKVKQLGAFGYEILSTITPQMAVEKINKYINGSLTSEQSYKHAIQYSKSKNK